jgi:hypothetical protein
MKSGTCSEMLIAGTTLKRWHLNIENNPSRKGARIVCFLYSNASVSIKVQERLVPALKCSEQVPH